MMNILGIILLFVALGFFIFVYRVEKERDRLKYILPLITAFGTMGFALILRENIIEFPIPGVGTIKTVAQKTLKDTELVEEIRKTVLAQSETIGLIAKQFREIQPEVSRVTNEVKKFERYLHEMKDNIQKEYQTLSEEVSRVKLQDYLPVLRNKAVSQGNREAFKEITRIARSTVRRNFTPIQPSHVEGEGWIGGHTTRGIFMACSTVHHRMRMPVAGD
jgi:hypothetical protein